MKDYDRISEVGERQESQERRERNRSDSAALLAHNGIPFEVKNYGAHLVVRYLGQVADLWPGTGLYVIRDTHNRKRGRGIFNMLKRMGATDIKRLQPDRGRAFDGSN